MKIIIINCFLLLLLTLTSCEEREELKWEEQFMGNELAVGVLTLGDYQDASAYLMSNPTASMLYSAYLAIVIIGFYSYFWTQAGQTLGMRAWKLKLQNEDGSHIKITQAFIRIATSAFGLGNLLAFNNKRRSMQDIMAECEMVVTEKVH